ncbi:MAG: Zn-dependent hydrolase [Proteobacteria bacterium]|nr:Zn-dependent hydrolase [Pseudomonadota bacterium]
MAERNIRIDGGRLWHSLMEMAKIGATEKGGVKRLALTQVDKEGRDLFVRWCKEAGCTIRIDKVGNIFAHRAGRNGNLAPVITGSHLDSQPTGGKFDGAYGVLAGLEVLRTLNDFDYQTERPLEVAVWTNEEGSRFAPGMIASGAFAGVFDLDFALSLKDPEGKSFGDELERIGYAGNSEVTGHDVHAYIEVHIEQGPILEAEDKTIGIVTDAQGQRWYEVVLEGVESHAGPTPMDSRHDALLGAGRVVDLVNRVGLDHAPLACATVGMLEVYPNSRNVIPGRVFLTVDLRHPDDEVLAQMDRKMRHGAAAIAENIGLACEIEQISYCRPVRFEDSCIKAVRNAAEKCGYSTRDMVSGAGHDACHLAAVAPTSMIFIPCIDGISHNEIEDAKPEWITAGANILLHALLEKANQTADGA